MTLPDGQPDVNARTEATEGPILPLPGGDIRVCQDGPREAPALLLIHGSASSTRSRDQLVPLLTGSYRVIRIDLPGHGRSAEPSDRGYEIPEQGRTVGGALDRLGFERALVVGHSGGGYAATALIEQRPDLVAALSAHQHGPQSQRLHRAGVRRVHAGAVATGRRADPPVRRHGLPRRLSDSPRGRGRSARDDLPRGRRVHAGVPRLSWTNRRSRTGWRSSANRCR
ncbi:alpha/beta fold hydrolase [Streptomyces sp. NPDC059818]|uniref:alpha/beta fold hydrolase n=1 Tax=Streptomyces sp. NPDC059818 TaxID=3346962 RepID=UPI0036629D6A